jgi:hypothetical protein
LRLASRQPTPSPKKQDIRIRLLKYESTDAVAFSQRIAAISRNKAQKLIRKSFQGVASSICLALRSIQKYLQSQIYLKSIFLQGKMV